MLFDLNLNIVRKNKLSQTLLSAITAILSSLALSSAAAAGENIVWGGTLGELSNITIDQEDYDNTLTSNISSSDNTITVDISGTGPDFVIGGYSNGQDNVSNNTINISNGAYITQRVYGGRALNGDVEGNTVNIENSEVKLRVHGGRSNFGNAYNNTVNLLSGTIIHDNVFGGHAANGDVEGNTVNIYNSEVEPGTYSGSVYGGYTRTGDALNNNVNIYNGDVVGNVFGGSTDNGSANGNSIFFSSGDIGANIYGGRTNTTTSGEEANNNIVIVTGGTINGGVYGGWGDDAADANQNFVSISGNTVISGEVYAGHSINGNAIGNSVYVSGGSIGGIRGGWSTNAEASNNTVTITGNAVLNNALYGGEGVTSTGNTLNLWDFSGVSNITTVDYFQNYNFIVPLWAESSGTYLTADFLNLNSSSYTAETLVTGVSFHGGGTVLSANSILYLIKANTTGSIDNANTGEILTANKGATLLYDYEILQDTSGVYIEIDGVRANPKAKAIVEGRAATQALVNEGASHLANKGIDSLSAATENRRGGWNNPAFFSSIQGNDIRYNTGSHVDVKSVSLLAGIGWKHTNCYDTLLTGVAFESGYGDFSGYNSYYDYGTIHSSGHGYFVGGGILAKYTTRIGLYVEGTLRAGNSHTNYSAGYTDNAGIRPRWSVSSPYYGAHTGLGYILTVDDKSSVDFYSKYFLTRLSSKSDTLSTGDNVKFDNADSQRWRNGARYNYKFDKDVTGYVGAAYEYEFNGKTRASTSGYSLGSPTLEGGSGIGELGVNLKKDAMTVDFSVQGYVGQQEGIGGTIQFTYGF